MSISIIGRNATRRDLTAACSECTHSKVSGCIARNQAAVERIESNGIELKGKEWNGIESNGIEWVFVFQIGT